jgi:type ISP restriction-modification system protein
LVFPYGYRTLGRAYAIFDVRLGDRLRPDLYRAHSHRQVYLTSLFNTAIGNGPAAVAAHLMPDRHHFRGSFGGKDVIPLWRDAEGTEPNLTSGVIEQLCKEYSDRIGPDEPFAYAYAVLANPGYVSRFWEELSTPGPRLPITKDAGVFRRGVELGRRLIRLHTYGERMMPEGQAAEVPQGTARCLAAVPGEPASYPEDYDYDPTKREVRVGLGRFGPVEPQVYEFSVSGFEVVKAWLSYRMKHRSGRRSSPLDDIGPERWTARMSEEFLELLWVLEHTLALYPELDAFLSEVVAGPCFLADELPRPKDDERRPLRRAVGALL